MLIIKKFRKGVVNMKEYSMNCKDMGVDCDYVATGATPKEVKAKMMKHGMESHKEMMEKMSTADKMEMENKMNKAIMVM